MARKCTKFLNACSQPLFCSLNVLFCHVADVVIDIVVVVIVVVCIGRKLSAIKHIE